MLFLGHSGTLLDDDVDVWFLRESKSLSELAPSEARRRRLLLPSVTPAHLIRTGINFADSIMIGFS